MLGLPWPAWGETDVLLAMARREVDASACPCGCGQDVSVATDAATEGRWQPTVTECYARAALEEWQERHKDDLPRGALVGVRLLADGEERTDPIRGSLDEQRTEYERLRQRLGGPLPEDRASDPDKHREKSGNREERHLQDEACQPRDQPDEHHEQPLSPSHG